MILGCDPKSRLPIDYTSTSFQITCIDDNSSSFLEKLKVLDRNDPNA
jgi:hypothetical protein